MEQHFIEVTNRDQNWGKFLLLRFAEEWDYESAMVPGASLLRQVGWNPNQIWVLDLQTSEGTAVSPGGCPSYDLNQKHQIWVCPMYEPFLHWLYAQKFERLSELPAKVDLTEAEFEFRGYRRDQGGKVEVGLGWLKMLVTHAEQAIEEMGEASSTQLHNLLVYLEDKVAEHEEENDG